MEELSKEEIGRVVKESIEKRWIAFADIRVEAIIEEDDDLPTYIEWEREVLEELECLIFTFGIYNVD